jgi:hypothetical protein
VALNLDMQSLYNAASAAGPGSSALDASAARLATAKKRSRDQMMQLLALIGSNRGGRELGMPIPMGGGGIAIGGGKLSGNVETWITHSMKATGLPERYRGILRTLVMKESGGNPNAVNRWDINAKRGFPTKGIGQARDDTFAANRLRGFQGARPGEGDIFDPEENLVADIRYALGRYHDLNNLPGVVSMRRGGGWKGY